MNSMIGIDKDYKKDTLIGIAVGAVFSGINKISSNFALGSPAAQMSVGDVEKLIVTGAAAPIFEEGLFRGAIPYFFGKLFHNSKLLSNFWVINIFQAALFALFHFVAYGTGYQTAFVGAFIFGFVSGILVKYTNSLLPSMVAHAIFNIYLFSTNYLAFGGV